MSTFREWALETIPSESTQFIEGISDLIEDQFVVASRADLPLVREVGDDFAVAGHPGVIASRRSTAAGPERFRQIAYAHLALAEWLDAEPPIDEAEVEALAEEVRRIGGPSLGGGSTPTPDEFARRLVAAGWKR